MYHPQVEISEIEWQVHLGWKKTPKSNFRSTTPLEDAVKDLIDLYNQSYDADPNRLDWIVPSSNVVNNSSIRKIEAGDIVQIRRIKKREGDMFFSGYAFFYDGQAVKMIKLNGDTPVYERAKEIEKIIGVPKTVGDFALLERDQQDDFKYVTLQIMKYGKRKNSRNSSDKTSRIMPSGKTPNKTKGKSARFQI